MLGRILGNTGAGGVISAMAYMGCVTALAITGHITGSEALTALGLLGVGVTATVATHMTGSVIAKVSNPPAPATGGAPPADGAGAGAGAGPSPATGGAPPAGVPTVVT